MSSGGVVGRVGGVDSGECCVVAVFAMCVRCVLCALHGVMPCGACGSWSHGTTAMSTTLHPPWINLITRSRKLKNAGVSFSS